VQSAFLAPKNLIPYALPPRPPKRIFVPDQTLTPGLSASGSSAAYGISKLEISSSVICAQNLGVRIICILNLEHLLKLQPVLAGQVLINIGNSTRA
jgi:hypothetical protein